MYVDNWCIPRTFTKPDQISDEILNSHALKTALQVCTKEQTKERLTDRRTMCFIRFMPQALTLCLTLTTKRIPCSLIWNLINDLFHTIPQTPGALVKSYIAVYNYWQISENVVQL